MSSQRASRRLRRAYKQQKGCCFICQRHVPEPGEPVARDEDRPSIEHVIPRALMGNDDEANCAMSHKGCNARRGSRTPSPEEFDRLAAFKGRAAVETMIAAWLARVDYTFQRFTDPRRIAVAWLCEGPEPHVCRTCAWEDNSTREAPCIVCPNADGSYGRWEPKIIVISTPTLVERPEQTEPWATCIPPHQEPAVS
jgi:hypothetical protein